MTLRTVRRIPLGAAISQLYGYIYCMLLSNMLVDMPLFGGALYLCGEAVVVACFVFGRRGRALLPGYARGWIAALSLLLTAIAVLITGLYPATLESGKTWVLFTSVILCICVDAVTTWVIRRGEGAGGLSKAALAAGVGIPLAASAGMAAVLVVNLGAGDGWPLAGAYALMVCIRVWFALRRTDDREAAAADETAPERITGIHAYRSMEWISLLLVAAVELTVAVMYALLATNQEWLLGAIAVAVACTVIPAEAGAWILHRLERKGNKDPTWLLACGLILWLLGVVLCSRMLKDGHLEYGWVYCYLAICTVGSTLSLTGLGRIEQLMPEAMTAAGQKVPAGYWRLRIANWDLARLIGDLAALGVLTVFCFVNGKDLPRDMATLAARFRPVMLLPLLLVIIGAMISVYLFPLSRRYIGKVHELNSLRETGGENPALQRQVEHAVTEKYRQPWMSRVLTIIFGLYYRHRVLHADRIEPDSSNPLVFLCNHGEIYGPIVCKLYIPVPVRAWTTAEMMFDQKDVTEYLFENTFGKMTFLPRAIRRLLARFVSWLSVNVMTQIECIPVYRDSPMKLRDTVRQSLEALEAGDNLLIFPESTDRKYEREGIGSISPGFLMMAEAYWKKMGRKMRMLPTYVNREKRTISFGYTITYEPENGFHAEEDRIVAEVEKQILELAEE